MKKYFLFIFLSILLTNPVESQIFSIPWQACYGGSKADDFYDLAKTNNGYILVGASQSSDGDLTVHYGGDDAWVIVTDSIGNLLWQKSYGGSLGDVFQRVLPTTDGNFYLVGSTKSSDGTIDYDPYPTSGDYWVVKIDSLGSVLWQKLFGGNGLDQFWDASLTTDGGIVAVGWTDSDDGDVSQYYGGWDTWVIKLDSTGEKQWDFTIGTSIGFEYGQAIIQTSDGGYLVGISANPEGDGNVTCIPHSYNAEGILFKLDSDGNEEWQQCYGGSNHDGITLLTELPDGYMFGGYTASFDGDLTGCGNHGGTDMWIGKTDFGGNSLWQKCYGGSKGDFLNNFFCEADGIFISGHTISDDYDVQGNHSFTGYNDLWIIKINDSGDMEWQQCIGGKMDEYTRNKGAVKISDHEFVLAGITTYSPSFDVDCDCQNNGYPDYWLLDIRDSTVGTPELLKEADIKIYPNPANTILNVSLPGNFNPEKTKLDLMDITGRTILTLKPKSNDSHLDISNLNRGIYLLKISNNQSAFTEKVMIY